MKIDFSQRFDDPDSNMQQHRTFIGDMPTALKRTRQALTEPKRMPTKLDYGASGGSARSKEDVDVIGLRKAVRFERPKQDGVRICLSLLIH